MKIHPGKPLLLLILILNLPLSAEVAGSTDSAYHLQILEDSVPIRTFKNYSKIEIGLKSGEELYGRFKFINDSQLCRVNYFYESLKDTVNLRDIKSINHLAYTLQPRERSGQKTYLGTGAVVAILVFTGYIGMIYLIVREIILVNKYGSGHRQNRLLEPKAKKIPYTFKLVKLPV